MKISSVKISQVLMAALTVFTVQAQQQPNHPMVQAHVKEWYTNWLTCSVCKTWAATL